jgi:hypothetical protein
MNRRWKALTLLDYLLFRSSVRWSLMVSKTLYEMAKQSAGSVALTDHWAQPRLAFDHAAFQLG